VENDDDAARLMRLPLLRRATVVGFLDSIDVLVRSGGLVAAEQLVLLEDDPAEGRRLGREALAWYLTLPNYTDNLRWLGFSDEDLAGGGSAALVDALVAWGDENAIRGRVLEHLEAGADHVCIQPIGRSSDSIGIEQLRRLGPALLDL